MSSESEKKLFVDGWTNVDTGTDRWIDDGLALLCQVRKST